MDPKYSVAEATVDLVITTLSDLSRKKSSFPRACKRIVFGLGTGSTIAIFWDLLLEKIKAQPDILPNDMIIVIIPTSLQSRELVIKYQYTNLSMILGDLLQYETIDLLVDGFDGADVAGNMIKGGGGAHLQEKVVAFYSKHSIYIGTDEKVFSTLNESNVKIPLEVYPMAIAYIEKELKTLGFQTERRVCKGGKIGPVITDNGNLIIDISSSKDLSAWQNLKDLDQRLSSITGVLGTGLFVGLANVILTANAKGFITKQDFEGKRTDSK